MLGVIYRNGGSVDKRLVGSMLFLVPLPFEGFAPNLVRGSQTDEQTRQELCTPLLLLSYNRLGDHHLDR